LEHKHTGGIVFDADCSNIQKDFDMIDVIVVVTKHKYYFDPAASIQNNVSK